MSVKSSSLWVVGMLVIVILLSGCTTGAKANLQTQDPSVPPTIASTSTSPATPFQAMTNTPMIIPPTYTPTATFTPTSTSTPTPTDTPTPTATPGLVWNPSGDVIAPILLYHHISDAGGGNRYYVTPDVFRAQLQALRDWGYTSITISQMVDALIHGADLPARPVVITFDDGNIDVYQNAFPIMNEMGFVGTFYIVANRLQSRYFVNVDQLQEMINSGWEIGDHGMSHIDLTLDYSTVGYEMSSSRTLLEDALGVKVNTFAYPYGKADEFIFNKTSEYGFLAGMGLGLHWEHTWGTLYYLNRIEIQSDYDMNRFATLLPWSNP